MKNFTILANLATVCLCASACQSTIENPEAPTTRPHAKVQLVCGMAVTQTANHREMRAQLTANGKAMTDLYIFDYDKQSGRLLQVLHQTSIAPDFAEPELTLDYGEHVLKVIASRSEVSVLQTENHTPYPIADNKLTPMTDGNCPTLWTSNKTSDSFGAVREVSVGIGTAQRVDLTLDRLVAKLVVKSTDTLPIDCSTIEVTLNEYRDFTWQTFDVTEAVKNQRTTDVSTLAGKTGTTISYFLLAPKRSYTTDVTFRVNRQNGNPYATFTVPDVPLERNKITTITGSLYNHAQGISVSLNDQWQETGNDIVI